MLRPFPTLKGKFIQTVYSEDTDDLFDEGDNAANDEETNSGKL